MKLNLGQQTALDQLLNFIISDSRFFILKGAAGTGKSTIIKHFKEEVEHLFKTFSLVGEDGGQPPIYFSATTNKAADVLRHMMSDNAITIHSLLGLRPVTTNRHTKLIQKNFSTLPDNSIIFIDEASYIDEELFSFIERCTNNVKVIFCGDEAQLTPIGTDESIVFTKQFQTFELTELMRQPDTDLQKLCIELRNFVMTGDEPNQGINDTDIIWLPETEFKDSLVKDMSHPNWNSQDSKFICYTNKKAIEINNMVKEAKSGSPRIKPGDLLLNNKYIKNGDTVISTDALVYVSHVENDVNENCVDGAHVTINSELFFCPYNMAKANKALEKAYSSGHWAIIKHIESMWIDLRPAYGITTHKAQGSTFKDVYIDLTDLKKSKWANQELYRRLLYVATSRASNRVIYTGG